MFDKLNVLSQLLSLCDHYGDNGIDLNVLWENPFLAFLDGLNHNLEKGTFYPHPLFFLKFPNLSSFFYFEGLI